MKKILLVEDEPYTRGMFKKMIELNPEYQVIETSDGEEALTEVKNSSIDYIFLDFNLPNLGGDTTLKYLKDDPDTKDIPVTMISALLPESIKQLCQEYNVPTLPKTKIPGVNPQKNSLLEILDNHFVN